jgi:hypothetical protein
MSSVIVGCAIFFGMVMISVSLDKIADALNRIHNQRSTRQ